MKRKLARLALLLCITSLAASRAEAAAWNVPTNVRVVQKSNTDTSGRVYGNIQAAIDSITTASATNPHVVKVMPGVYDLGTASLRMKPYVDLEGSGPDNTIITSSNSNVDGSTCTVGTVLMANNTTIRNLRVVNRAPALGGAYTTVAALVFNGVKAKAEHVTLMTGSDTAIGGQNDGACTYGAFADATLNEVTIEARNGGVGQANAVITMGGRLTITNSSLAAYNNGGSGGCDVVNDNSPYQEPSTVAIDDSRIVGVCANVTSIYAGENVLTVSDSTLVLNVPPGGRTTPFTAYNETAVTNTRILVAGDPPTYSFGDGTKARIATSELPGAIENFAGVRLVNNHDASFNPIPNQ